MPTDRRPVLPYRSHRLLPLRTLLSIRASEAQLGSRTQAAATAPRWRAAAKADSGIEWRRNRASVIPRRRACGVRPDLLGLDAHRLRQSLRPMSITPVTFRLGQPAAPPKVTAQPLENRSDERHGGNPALGPATRSGAGRALWRVADQFGKEPEARRVAVSHLLMLQKEGLRIPAAPLPLSSTRCARATGLTWTSSAVSRARSLAKRR